jgi:mycothione reductase
MAHFDLVIIGTGSGNSILSPAFDDWNVAIIEEGAFGGTCLNRGCIPTKMFVYVADLIASLRHAPCLGLDATVDAVRWRDLRDRVFARIDPIAEDGEAYRAERCPNVTVFKGRGEFVEPKTVMVGDAAVSGERIVIAAGGRPMIPAIPGLAETGYFTSDDIMRVDEVPERLAILGGGFIAAEMAHLFDAVGASVTLINRSDALLRHEDHDVSDLFTARAKERFDVRLNDHVTRVARSSRDAVVLTLDNSGPVEVDAILVATGRIPNTDILGLYRAGYMLHADGRIVVNGRQETNVPGVWALGDISSDYMLKHVANHEARIVAHNLVHPEAPIEADHRYVPHAVFTSPQIASVGLTELEARLQSVDIMISARPYGDTAYGWAMEDEWGFCKLIADRSTRRLVGAHLIGPYSSMLLQQLIQGMTFGQTIDEMAHGQYYTHPALSEVIENALLGFPPA